MFLDKWFTKVNLSTILLSMDKKDKQFHMRLSHSEGLALEQLAKRAGVSKSSYFRNLIRDKAKKAKIPIWP